MTCSATHSMRRQCSRSGLRAGGAGLPHPERGHRRTLQRLFRVWPRLLLPLALWTLLTPLPARAATAPGTVIDNIAAIRYQLAGTPLTGISSPARIVTAGSVPATLEVRRQAPGDPGAVPTFVPVSEYGLDAGATLFAPLPPGAIDLSQPIPLAPAAVLAAGEPIFLILSDPDQDRDPAAADTVLIRLDASLTGDREILRLTETAPAGGIFAGYFPTGATPATSFDGLLATAGNDLVTARYASAGDPADTTAATVRIATGASALWLQMAAGQELVAVGDHLPFRLTLENTGSSSAVSAVTLTDRLPPGLRFRAGSVRIDGARGADPDVSADGRTLSFPLGDLPPGAVREVRFVVEVAAGARPGETVNRAQAAGAGGAASNAAAVRLRVREDLFRGTGFLVGRVTLTDRSAPGVDLGGVPQVRIYLEDGTHAITDREGMFHFEGIRPGVHVIQLDLDTLPEGVEPVAGERDSRLAGRAFSRFVDLQGGTLWRTDFLVARRPSPKGHLELELTGSLTEEAITCRVRLRGAGMAAQDLRLLVTLPAGASYLPASSRLSGQPLADPEIDGDRLTFTLPEVAGDWTGELQFQAAFTPAAGADPATRAHVRFVTPDGAGHESPEAETVLHIPVREESETLDFLLIPTFPSMSAALRPQDRANIERIAEKLAGLAVEEIVVIGHTDDLPIPRQERHLFADNLALSQARADNVARYLAQVLGMPPARITAVGLANMVPAGDGDADEGREADRRVEIRVRHSRLVPALPAQGLQAGSAPVRVETVVEVRRDVPPAAAQALSAAPTAQGILAPAAADSLATPIHAVRVLLDARLTPQLLLDGEEVPPDRIGFRRSDRSVNQTLYSYIGVDFGPPGEHRLELKGLDPFGNTRFEQQLTVVRTGEIEALRQVEGPDNIADGRTPVRARLALLDGQGQPVRAPVALELRNGDLRPWRRGADLREEREQENSVRVDPEGFVTFAPVSRSGIYRATLACREATVEVEVFVRPQPRDWILVGLAEGTAGYRTLSEKMEGLAGPEVEEHFFHEGRIAFFARGRIKGKWLLTLAYDSDKPDRRGESLHQIIDPDTYYTLYGDGAAQGYEAPSAEKLYVKIERDRFYALFGDYQTGLTVTELSRYNRSLTGIKTELLGRRFGFTLFASETGQSFVKDELRGDGTSGLYRLSRRDLVENSEQVTLETRDRFHSERILASRSLLRHIDYDIDYDAGTLFFKEPVPSKDENFNPIFIVVDYETGGRDGNLTWGGRGHLRLLDDRLAVGATLVREQQTGAGGELYGLDAAWTLLPDTVLRAEAAASKTQSLADSRRDTAYLVELGHRSARLEARLYLREQGEDFGLGQQNAGEAGTRKAGLEAVWRLTRRWRLEGQAFRQETMATGGEREVREAAAAYRGDRFRLSAGLRRAVDDLPGSAPRRTDQATAQADWQATSRLTLRVGHDQSLGGRDASFDYPTRTLLGAEYRLAEEATLFAQQEFTDGAGARTEGTRLGLRAHPWRGGQICSALENRFRENDARLFANLGLKQTWQITDRLSLDLGLDRSQTFRQTGRPSLNPRVPPASGSTEDFSAVSLGARYRREDWDWNSRLEYRESDREERWGGFGSVVGEPGEGLGVSARVRVSVADRREETAATEGDLRFGVVFRPAGGRWTVLNRTDLIYGEEGSPNLDRWRVVNNLNLNLKPGRRLQLALQYGAKYAADRIDEERYRGYTDLVGAEVRFDLTERWDLGLRGSLLHSWQAGQLDFSAGASVGCRLVENVWVSAGYNLLGFRDLDFSRVDFTARGPFLRFRIKLDQQTVRQAAEWLARR